jgi:outer membrane scaffolding protein for murein synthesis (MipA/OmpV family)
MNVARTQFPHTNTIAAQAATGRFMMKRSTAFVRHAHGLAVAVLCLVSFAAAPRAGAAESEAALVPLPSVPDFTRGGGWGVALGAGIEYEAAYNGSDEYEVEFEPAVAVQWRRDNQMLFFEGFELGWRGRFADLWLLQAGLEIDEGLEPDDSDDGALDGLPERDSHVVGVLEARRGIGGDWRNWIAVRVLGGESDAGLLGVLSVGHVFGDGRPDGTGTEIFAFVTFADSTYINNDFGVSEADSAASGLAPIDLDGGFRSASVNLIHRRNLGQRLQLVAAAGYELYSSDIADSPIARDDFEYDLELSLLWRF